MNEKLINILLVEDNPGDARLVREMLGEVQGFSYNMGCAGNLSMGQELIAKGGIDVILLDLSLPDSQGLDTLDKVQGMASEVPIIIMTGLGDEELAVEAVKKGAQDYLVKGQMDSSSFLVRTLRYAIERNRHVIELSRMHDELRNLSLTDDLTGLYNRRGFLTLAQQELRLVKRTRKAAFLLFADLDSMKWINDTLGHKVGDCALRDTAEVLKETFRESDIVARIGGDEFATLVTEASSDCKEIIVTRLQERLETYNSRRSPSLKYKLSLSMGIVGYDPKSHITIYELMDRADALMYEHKRRKGGQ